MGIKKLFPFLKEKTPNAFGEYPLSTWRGKRIAIDANNWLYTTMATSHSTNIRTIDVTTQIPDNEKTFTIWLRQLKYFILKFLEQGVTPVFVFDGGPPVQKDTTLMERRNNREDILSKVDEAKLKVEKGAINPEDVEELQKLYRKALPVTDNEIDAFKAILSGIGIPYIAANMEAEEACTILCIEGIVAAVYSADSDNLTRGCPVLIRKFEKGKRKNPLTGLNESYCEVVILNYVLSSLQFSYSQFVDLCIMFGCDYNTNIPGVGSVGAYNYMINYKNIDNIPSIANKDVLNHIVCRQVFACKKVSEISSKDMSNLQVDRDEQSMRGYGYDLLRGYGIADWIDDLIKIYKGLPLATNSCRCVPGEVVTPQQTGPKIVIINNNNDHLTNQMKFITANGITINIKK